MTEKERLIALLEEESAFSRYMTADERRGKLQKPLWKGATNERYTN